MSAATIKDSLDADPSHEVEPSFILSDEEADRAASHIRASWEPDEDPDLSASVDSSPQPPKPLELNFVVANRDGQEAQNQGPIEVIADVPKRTEIVIKDEPSVVLVDERQRDTCHLPPADTFNPDELQTKPRASASPQRWVVGAVIGFSSVVLVAALIRWGFMSDPLVANPPAAPAAINSPAVLSNSLADEPPSTQAAAVPQTPPAPTVVASPTVTAAATTAAATTAAVVPAAPTVAVPTADGAGQVASRPSTPPSEPSKPKGKTDTDKDSSGGSKQVPKPKETSSTPAGGIVRETPF